ncbi:MAG: tetratricopeptide repeat protein [Planctomycetota bacterium]|nr:tetratricopeptide repeat protein [Planctomycetota bacterium]
MSNHDIDRLVSRTRSYLSVYDETGLLRYLKSAWPVTHLIKLLAHRDAAVVKVSATCLGVLGDPVATSALLASLPHEDAVVSTMAEFSLWSIWFKERGASAESLLRQAGRLQPAEAVSVLDALADRYPDWAEPHNQRAIVNFKEHRFVESISDCRRVLAIQEHHFGAWAGLGQCYARLGEHAKALECYARALEIYPRLSGIRQSQRAVREQAGQTQFT